MAEYTKYLGLEKPGANEYVNIQGLNQNFDRLDTEAKRAASEIEENKAKLSDLFNPNILINPDFSINQRGKQDYAEEGYTVDRWYYYRNYGRLSPMGQNNGRGGIWMTGGIRQYIEAPWRFAGKELTLSAHFSNLTTGSYPEITISAHLSNGKNVKVAYADYSYTSDVEEITLVASGVVPINVTILNIDILNDDEEAVIGLDWVKLEVGKEATSFISPDPSTELLKCQRYYEKINTYVVVPYAGGGLPTVPFMVEKRVNPTVTITSLKCMNSIEEKEYTGVYSDKTKISKIIVPSAVMGGCGFAINAEIDAELY